MFYCSVRRVSELPDLTETFLYDSLILGKVNISRIIDIRTRNEI